MTGYSRHLYVGWGDLDANGHMRNTAYLDMAADVRMFYFSEQGFPPLEWARLGVGPVIQRDTLDYRRELRMLDPVQVTLAMEGLSPDASRFVMVNEFLRADGQLAARVSSAGGWLDRKSRTLVVPPPALAVVLLAAPRTPGFKEQPGLGAPSRT